MSALLSVRGVTKSFGRTPVLVDVSLDVQEGSITAVLGPSGCGKTTLLRLVAGLERVDAGEIELGGRIVSAPHHHVAPERRRVGYVPQEGALYPHLEVRHNVSFGLAWSRRRRGEGVEELLELVGLDPELAGRFPHQLSGGQQQRVALARALAADPALVLLDEPFSSLDAGSRESTRRAVVRALRARGATAVLVTHDQAEALSTSDAVVVMTAGRILQVASPSELYRHPVDAPTALFVGAAVVLDGMVESGGVRTELGRLELAGRPEPGPVDVLIRPEQLQLGGTGTPADVVSVTFYGHDALVELAIGNGTVLTARVPGQHLPVAGSRTAVSVDGPVTVFALGSRPAPDSAQDHAPAGG